MRHSNRIKVETQQSWLQRNDTQRLLALEGGWIADWICQLHGHQLAYAGVDDHPRFMREARMQHCFRLGLPWQRGLVDVQAQIQDAHWPLADETVDAVILQHTLDMTSRPHQMIREATRSIVPSGYLIVVGFNPQSWWGALRWVRTFSAELPWVANPVAPKRLVDWLTLLDFRIESVTPVAHSWPFKLFSESVSRRIDRVMAGANFPSGNVYVLVARKTQAGMTTIRPRRRAAPEPRFGFAVPAARVSEDAVSSHPYQTGRKCES
ncbi:class I SAM-dependent methyltransferase [Thalassolituus sp.]|jgi:SAM-dependent methyltransferase|uniref:class I SAM-dependent methyltransferase n=1 Tax=Thalassolituus sp. TaxID=2030822 RepID=UPI002A830E8A|nr:methyltransferase domain-containing protein [Thalassolituus sp.]